ncbi:hypothetical protein [Roseobacter sp. A03A-229]
MSVCQKQDEERRTWRKLHIAMDAGTGEIMPPKLTNDDTSDPEMVTPLMTVAGGRIRHAFPDGTYNGQPTYDVIREPAHLNSRRRS